MSLKGVGKGLAAHLTDHDDDGQVTADELRQLVRKMHRDQVCVHTCNTSKTTYSNHAERSNTLLPTAATCVDTCVFPPVVLPASK